MGLSFGIVQVSSGDSALESQGVGESGIYRVSESLDLQEG